MKVRYLFDTDRGVAVMDDSNSGYIIKRGAVSTTTLGWQTIDVLDDVLIQKLPTYTAEIVEAYNKVLPAIREHIWREGLVDFSVKFNYTIKQKG